MVHTQSNQGGNLVSLDQTECASIDPVNSVATAHWCAESARPFTIVKDRCYKWLQQEGHPDQYIIWDREQGKYYLQNANKPANVPAPGQLLSVTCDNASANNKMIDKLKVLLPSFIGQRGHV